MLRNSARYKRRKTIASSPTIKPNSEIAADTFSKTMSNYCLLTGNVLTKFYHCSVTNTLIYLCSNS